MNDRSSAAFESYRDVTKQAVTLATGVLALSVTFVTDVVEDVDAVERGFLLFSWLMLLLSVAGGVLTLMGISGALHCIENEDEERCKELGQPVTIYSTNIRPWSILQLGLFAVGLLLLIVFGVLTI